MNRRTKSRILNDDFLEIRKSILDLAALLDRFDDAPDDSSNSRDQRLEQIREALAALGETDRPRAETVQRIFSLAYDPNWPAALGVRTKS
jgi:hypothetical protein